MWGPSVSILVIVCDVWLLRVDDFLGQVSLLEVTSSHEDHEEELHAYTSNEEDTGVKVEEEDGEDDGHDEEDEEDDDDDEEEEEEEEPGCGWPQRRPCWQCRPTVGHHTTAFHDGVPARDAPQRQPARPPAQVFFLVSRLSREIQFVQLDDRQELY